MDGSVLFELTYLFVLVQKGGGQVTAPNKQILCSFLENECVAVLAIWCDSFQPACQSCVCRHQAQILRMFLLEKTLCDPA